MNLYKKRILCLHSFVTATECCIIVLIVSLFIVTLEQRKVVRGEITKVKCCSNVIIMTESFRKGDERGEWRKMTEKLEVRRRYQKDHHPSFSAPIVVGSRVMTISTLFLDLVPSRYLFVHVSFLHNSSGFSLTVLLESTSHYCFLWTTISITFIIDVRERRRKKTSEFDSQNKIVGLFGLLFEATRIWITYRIIKLPSLRIEEIRKICHELDFFQTHFSALSPQFLFFFGFEKRGSNVRAPVTRKVYGESKCLCISFVIQLHNDTTYCQDDDVEVVNPIGSCYEQ